MKFYFKVITIIIIVFVLLQERSIIVKSSASSCSVGVSPSSVEASSSQTLTFTIQNTDSVAFQWIKITRPNSNFTVTGGSATRWSASTSDNSVTFTGWQLSQGASFSYSVGVNAGSLSSGPEGWNVQVSDEAGGGGAISCSGDSQVAVTGGSSPGDVTSPVLSGLSITNLSDSAATILWTTDEAANSAVSYGTTSGYGQTVSDGAFGTSHSLTITGLSANTTYHYQVSSSDSTGNQAQTSDNTFATAVTGGTTETITVTNVVTTTTTTTNTVTNTSTIVVTATPTPTPLPDRTPPNVKISSDLELPFTTPPVISGQTNDVRSSIAKVEYSLDGGENWLPVSLKSELGRLVQFEFQSEFLEDGNYDVIVRATDRPGNIGYSEKKTLVIDRLPPLVGGNVVSVGPQVITPLQYGSVKTIVGIPQVVTISAVGGPTAIDLVSGQYTFPLKRSSETGLWSGTIQFTESGSYAVLARSIDGAGNKTERLLNTFIVMEQGAVRDNEGKGIENAEVKIYLKDPETGTWVLWDAEAYGQKNPQKTGKNGTYTTFLPPGTYYLKIYAHGFKRTNTEVFSIDNSTALNSKISLAKKEHFAIGPFSFPLPDFLYNTARITIEDIQEKSTKDTIVNSEIPIISTSGPKGVQFDPFKMRGKVNIISFVALWSPPAIEQIGIIEKLLAQNPKFPITVIASQDNYSRVELFQKRGKYTIPFFADPDGRLVDPYRILSYPSNYIIDKKGVVVAVDNRVLSESDLAAYVKEGGTE